MRSRFFNAPQKPIDDDGTNWVIQAFDNQSWIKHQNGKAWQLHFEDPYGFQKVAAQAIVEVRLPSGRVPKMIFPGHDYVILLDKNGNCFVNGYNASGQFGVGRLDNPCCYDAFMPIPFEEKIETVIPGYGATFFKDCNGNWYACGDNRDGHLGLATRDWICIPTLLELDNRHAIDTIKTHYGRTFIKDVTGQWYGCGSANLLGLPLDDCLSLRLTPLPWNPQNICLGFTSTFLQNNTGEWFACGWNDYGQLGIASQKAHKPEPVIPPKGIPIAHVIPMIEETLFLNTQGEWHAAGRLCVSLDKAFHDGGKVGQVPIVKDKPLIQAYAAGSRHAFYLDAENIWCAYGMNKYGQLGLCNPHELLLMPQKINYPQLCSSKMPIMQMPISLQGLINNYQEAQNKGQLEKMAFIESLYEQFKGYHLHALSAPWCPLEEAVNDRQGNAKFW